MSAIIQQHLSPTFISPFTCFSNDHSLGTGFSPSELHFSRSATVKTHDSATNSSGYTAVSFTPQSSSLADLQLIVDLFSYPLQ
jgi:hypothetical protein